MNDHVLFKSGDAGIPNGAKDSNGEIVLAVCKVCGEYEAGLDKPCIREYRMLVLYHANCADGFGAAWAARKKYGACQCIPVNYAGTIPDVEGLDVLIVDFCFPEEVMALLKKSAASLMVIDHHGTAKDVASKYGIFDNSKSGAVLTWEYLFPNTPLPRLLQYVQDRDLWKWELPFSREFSAGLALYPQDFNVWNNIAEHTQQVVDAGSTVLLYQKQLIDKHVKNAVIRNIFGYNVPCVNATVLMSEIGEQLCIGHPFSATYFDRADGMRIWSLRSNKETGIDVGALAKTQPGGGGHKNAAGFQTLNPDVTHASG